jgi:hypothetical protein
MGRRNRIYGFEGNFNHAIMIRTGKIINYIRRGTGIVASSDEESEMQRVYNKLRALNTARSNGTNLIIINSKRYRTQNHYTPETTINKKKY